MIQSMLPYSLIILIWLTVIQFIPLSYCSRLVAGLILNLDVYFIVLSPLTFASTP